MCDRYVLGWFANCFKQQERQTDTKQLHNNSTVESDSNSPQQQQIDGNPFIPTGSRTEIDCLDENSHTGTQALIKVLLI